MGKTDALKRTAIIHFKRRGWFLFLGPSGLWEKPQTLRTIAGLIEPNDGTFGRWDNNNLTKVPVHKPQLHGNGLPILCSFFLI